MIVASNGRTSFSIMLSEKSSRAFQLRSRNANRICRDVYFANSSLKRVFERSVDHRRRMGKTNLDGDEILQRFAHLQTVNVQMPDMDETVDPFFATMIRLKVYGPISSPLRDIQISTSPQIVPIRSYDGETSGRYPQNGCGDGPQRQN